MKNRDSETIWNERKIKSQKQKRLDRHHSKETSVEKDLQFARRMAAAGNDRETYNTIFGEPGDYPAYE